VDEDVRRQVEVNKVEAHSAVTHRCDLDLSAAMPYSLQGRLERRSAHCVEDDPCAAATCCASHNGIEGPVFAPIHSTGP